MKYLACPRIYFTITSSALCIFLCRCNYCWIKSRHTRIHPWCWTYKINIFPVYIRMVAVSFLNTLPADIFELHRGCVILYIVRLNLKNALDIKNSFYKGRGWELSVGELFPVPFFALSLPIPEIYVLYRICLNEIHKGMLTKIGEVFVVLSKALPIQAWVGPYGSRSLRLPEFLDNRHMKVLRLLALCTSRLYPQKINWYSFVLESGSIPRP
jgi:hypothetical protein